MKSFCNSIKKAFFGQFYYDFKHLFKKIYEEKNFKEIKNLIISRIKKFIPILVPLIINEVIRSGELAEAMESRAYGAIKKPTSLYKLKFSQRDGISTITTLFIFFIIIIFQPNIDYAWEELLKQYGAGVI